MRVHVDLLYDERAVRCPHQDNKDLELELIPNSLSDSDPEVNLSDPSHQVSDEKRRSARKKEWVVLVLPLVLVLILVISTSNSTDVWPLITSLLCVCSRVFRYIMAELLQTERVYVRDLQECIEVNIKLHSAAVPITPLFNRTQHGSASHSLYYNTALWQTLPHKSGNTKITKLSWRNQSHRKIKLVGVLELSNISHDLPQRMEVLSEHRHDLLLMSALKVEIQRSFLTSEPAEHKTIWDVIESSRTSN